MHVCGASMRPQPMHCQAGIGSVMRDGRFSASTQHKGVRAMQV
jgi:hypothetical protein